MGSPLTLFSLSLLLFTSFYIVPMNGQNASAAKADVGVILELDTIFGKIFKTCISMALEDFYYSRTNHNTKIVPHFRDSKSNVVDAASAAIDLLKNKEVMAIFGPAKSIEADFVIDIGDKVRVPIISPAMSPYISPKESPYFIRSAWYYSSQAKAIAAIVNAFSWREVVLVFEDSKYGNGVAPFLIEDLMQINALVSYHSHISLSATSDQILQELYKMKTMQTRVFIVHMSPDLASRFFKMAKEAEMMEEGYAWIISDALTSLLDSVDSETIDSMQGVLGVKAYYNPRSNEFMNFRRRWSKRFREEYPDMDKAELNIYGLWAYDSITGLAEAIERAGLTSPQFKKPANKQNLTDLEAIGTSTSGPELVPLIRNMRFSGLSGDFHIADGQLQPSTFEIVNVIGKGENGVGFWTERLGISKKLRPDDHEAAYSTKKENLGAVVWPGKVTDMPKGWVIPTSGKILKVGVPNKSGFNSFIQVETDAETNAITVTGFCKDVFDEVMKSLPYAVQYEFESFDTPDYDELVQQIFLEKYDAVMGDVTIVANRSRFADFTFPFTESGVAAVVPIKDNQRKNAWIFMKPLRTSLWLTIGGFFVFTGFVVWVLEHRVNTEFRGPRRKQVGMIFWFSFSTLVFAHREKVVSNLTRFVVIVWVFVVLVLTSSYTANLTSMLTVQQLQPTITDIYDLIKNGEYIGYQDGSFVKGFMNSMKFDSSKFRNYGTLEEYDEALKKGSRNGGVGAIIDELPYIRLLLRKYCHKYTMIGPTYRTSGLGFAFPKGSPLAVDVSREILNLKEDEKMVAISRKWFGDENVCAASYGTVTDSESLSVDSFMGLFLIAGISSSLALAIFLSRFLYENRYIITSTGSTKQKLYGLARVFDQKKDDMIASPPSKEEEEAEKEEEESRSDDNGGLVLEASPAISISCHQQEIFAQDEGFSTTEPGSPTTGS